MSNVYLNFYGSMDVDTPVRDAQCFTGVASQPHRADAVVGANSASPTAVTLQDSTLYVEVAATSGNVFVCYQRAGATSTDLNAQRIRIDAGEKISLARPNAAFNTFYIWDA
jgi:hypothetical protein